MKLTSDFTQKALRKSAEALLNGYLVAFPTETVYGLGADAINETAVARIYKIKSRPPKHPLIVHISSVDNLKVWASEVPNFALVLATKFWPGPMTLILKRSNLAKNFITVYQESIGLRVPSHPLALELLNQFEHFGGQGIAAPSANRFGAVSTTTAKAVSEDIGEFLTNKDQILDGGQCNVGIESTILDCTGATPIVLRPGAITLNMVQTAINMKVVGKSEKIRVKFPGMMDLHYSPRAKIVISDKAQPGDGFLATSDIPTPNGAIRLGSPENIEQFAKILYESFRLADAKQIKSISITLPYGNELSYAIKDRVFKAAGIVL